MHVFFSFGQGTWDLFVCTPCLTRRYIMFGASWLHRTAQGSDTFPSTRAMPRQFIPDSSSAATAVIVDSPPAATVPAETSALDASGRPGIQPSPVYPIDRVSADIDRVGDHSQPSVATRSLAESLRVPAELTPTSVTLPFDLRFYRKKRAIQLKPAGDTHVHFSLAWGNKQELSLRDMDDMYERIVRYLKRHQWRLTFTLVIARGACTYGRFDESFEDLMFELRDTYPLCTKKNLAWEDHRGELEPESRPIIFHISHWSEALPEFAAFLKSARPGCDKQLCLDISVR